MDDGAAMGSAATCEPGLLLANCFEISGKRHRVQLSSFSIDWEREGTSELGWRVPFNEVVAIQPAEACRDKTVFSCLSSSNAADDVDSSLERVAFNITAFRLHFVERGWKHRWKLRSLVFQNPNSMVVHHWIATIQGIINEFSRRPRRLLVFVNPFGGKKRAPKIYHKKIHPLFELAGIDTQVIVTERANHARDLLQECSLVKLDGIIAIGGDGMFSELLNGLLVRTQKDAGLDHEDSQTELVRPELRIGIIPAGSTDAVAYSTSGTNDPVTAALHIIIGDSVAIDVCGVYHERSLIRYSTSMLAYGYFGDTLLDSEQLRWLGPLRYNWAGFKKVLCNRAYEGELLFKSQPQPETSPHDKRKCNAGCKVCERARDQTLSNLKSRVAPPENWSCLRGRFIAINNVTLSCMCGLTKQGLSPAAHIGDGSTDLILVKKCSRLNYARFLLRCAFHHDDPFALNFVRVFRVREFQFRPICLEEIEPDDPTLDASNKNQSFRSLPSHSSIWNCDGEVVEEPAINVRVFCQLVKLFARGIESDLYDSTFNNVTFNKPQSVKINVTGQ